jgi:hypothetical protein
LAVVSGAPDGHGSAAKYSRAGSPNCAAAVRVDTGDLVLLELDLEPGR